MAFSNDLIRTEQKGNTMCFTILGDIDHHSAKKVKKLIDSEIFITRPETIYMDLSQVDFMDSSGLGLILGRYRIATELGISFKLLNPTERVMKILTIAGCEKILTIVRKQETK